MKISKNLLKQIIIEELRQVLNETRLEHKFRLEPELPKGMPEKLPEKLNKILDSGPEGIQQALLLLSSFIDEKEAEEYVYQKLVVKFFKEHADEYRLEKDRKGFHLYINHSNKMHNSTPAKTLPYNVPAKEMYEEVMDLERMKGFYSHFDM
jgi:hypothetical protein